MSKKNIAKEWFDSNKALSDLPESLQTAYKEWEKIPEAHISSKAADPETAAQRFLLYSMLPAWFAPGVLDYLLHRRTKIEENSGLKESLIHSLMMAEVGLPIMMSLLLEINPLTLTLMSGAALAHEATAIWDAKAAAEGERGVSLNEQHIHSFLEVMPFMGVSIVAILNWDQVQATFGQGNKQPKWRLRWKEPRLSQGYLRAIILSIISFIVLPYGDELTHCLKAAVGRRLSAGKS